MAPGGGAGEKWGSAGPEQPKEQGGSPSDSPAGLAEETTGPSTLGVPKTLWLLPLVTASSASGRLYLRWIPPS